jgi:hypothetical protein
VAGKRKEADALLEEGDEVRLGRLLESHDGRRLEAEVRLEVLCDLTDEALEAESMRNVLTCTSTAHERERGAHGSLRMRSSVDFW